MHRCVQGNEVCPRNGSLLLNGWEDDSVRTGADAMWRHFPLLTVLTCVAVPRGQVFDYPYLAGSLKNALLNG